MTPRTAACLRQTNYLPGWIRPPQVRMHRRVRQSGEAAPNPGRMVSALFVLDQLTTAEKICGVVRCAAAVDDAGRMNDGKTPDCGVAAGQEVASSHSPTSINAA